MATIQFDDDIRRVRSIGSAGGVYSTRDISKSSNIGEKYNVKDVHIDELENQKSSSRSEGDIKKKQVSESAQVSMPCCLFCN